MEESRCKVLEALPLVGVPRRLLKEATTLAQRSRNLVEGGLLRVQIKKTHSSPVEIPAPAPVAVPQGESHSNGRGPRPGMKAWARTTTTTYYYLLLLLLLPAATN